MCQQPAFNLGRVKVREGVGLTMRVEVVSRAKQVRSWYDCYSEFESATLRVSEIHPPGGESPFFGPLTVFDVSVLMQPDYDSHVMVFGRVLRGVKERSSMLELCLVLGGFLHLKSEGPG